MNPIVRKMKLPKGMQQGVKSVHSPKIQPSSEEAEDNGKEQEHFNPFSSEEDGDDNRKCLWCNEPVCCFLEMESEICHFGERLMVDDAACHTWKEQACEVAKVHGGWSVQLLSRSEGQLHGFLQQLRCWLRPYYYLSMNIKNNIGEGNSRGKTD